MVRDRQGKNSAAQLVFNQHRLVVMLLQRNQQRRHFGLLVRALGINACTVLAADIVALTV